MLAGMSATSCYKKDFMLQSGRIVIVASTKLCAAEDVQFQNRSWNDENEEGADDTEAGSQAARYIAMVRESFRTPQWIRDGSRRSVRAVHQT